MSLWLCLRFHQLPLQCLNRTEQQPAAVLERQRVLRANDCAQALGIRQGMGAATVRALAGDGPLQLLQRDESAEQRCLQQLCCWAYGITPSLYSWRQDCLQLEVGGCLSLFRGLEPLLQEVGNGIASRGFQVEYGLAPTPQAAWHDFPLPTDEYPDTSFDFLGAWCGDNVFSITSAERPPDFRAAYTNRLKEDSERYHLKSNAVFGTSALRHDAMVGTVSSKSLEESMAEEAAKNMARAVDASIIQKIKEAADVGHIPKHKLKEMFKGIFGKDE